MHWLRGFVVLSVVLGCNCAWAQFEFAGATPPGRQRAVRARLVLSHEAAKPGDTVMAGLELKMKPGWHTYWRNGGDSGEPTEFHWGLPAGISAGEIQWPVPEKLIDRTGGGELITYVYHDRAVLLVPLKIAAAAPNGPQDVTALVKWLECEKTCVPGSNLVQASLTIGTTTTLSEETNFFAEAEQRLPKKQLPGTVAAKWDGPASGKARPFLIQWNANATEPDFFPFANTSLVISNQTEVLPSAGDKASLRKRAAKLGAQWDASVPGLLVRKENGTTVGYETTLKLTDSQTAISAPAAATSETKSIWVWLAYAFLGGLILNIMPCVLPVIALKILGFVSQAKDHPGQVRKLGLIYALGVLASFLGLAALVIGVNAAGHKAGWGMQFSDPKFIVGFTVLVTLVALNLFGLFEINLSGGVMGAAGGLASKHGASGAFFNGVLATILATPCTAPFLSLALGFAFSQSAGIIVLIFLTVGAGLAFPYVVLSWFPAWLKFLPKPGAWMEKFKIAMGFPMLATALWLASLATEHYGERSWWLGIFLVFVGLAAWVFGQFIQRGRSRKGLAAVIVLLLLGTGYVWALDSNLRWRSPIDPNQQGGATLKNAPMGYAWEAWSTESVAKARAEGRVVLIDFTAKWCITCNTIVKPALEKQALIEKLKEIRGVALVADYTHYPPVIAEELGRFNRGGVPLVVVYPKDSSASPAVLPDPNPVLGPGHYSGLILDALNAAAK